MMRGWASANGGRRRFFRSYLGGIWDLFTYDTWTGCVKVCHSSKDVDDEQHFNLVAQLTVMLDKSMPVFFSRPSLFRFCRQL